MPSFSTPSDSEPNMAGTRDMDWQSSHGIPLAVVDRLLHYIPHDSRSALRLTCKPWCRAIDKVTPLRRPVANTLPAEILLQIFHRLAPRDFDNARRTCSQWMRVSLDRDLLQRMLKRAGWWDSWLRDCQSSSLVVGEEESSVWKMSKRFATECLLSGRKVNVERPGFLTTAVVDFSQLSQRQRAAEFRRPSQPVITEIEPQTHVDGTPLFHVSDCGRYLLVASNRIISVYRLLSMRADFSTSPDADVALVARITCPAEVMATTIDTSSLKLTVAALLHSRLGMVCDLVPATDGPCADLRRTKYAMELVSRHFIYNVCSANDPPQSVSICPGRRCVAFGSGTGFELRWINGQTNQDCRKQFPMSQPSEVLHFFPSRPNAPRELRIISSLAGPGLPGCSCHGVHDGGKRPKCPFHLSADVQSLTRWDPQHNGDPDLVRATHCHNYHAIPINDGLHVLYVEPRTGHLCIGSDAPIGGPTSLTKTFVCVPPFDNSASEGISEGMAPTVFAAGSDLSWGLRVVAAYQDRLVLYSVPLDVFNVIRKERERQGDGVMGDSDLARDWFLDNQRSRKRRDSLVQNQNGDWEFLLSVSYRPTAMMWPFQIYGKEIGRVNDVVELALQSSNGGARIWAFDASGKTNVIDVDTFTSTAQPAADIPCKSVSVDTDGTVSPAQLVDRSVLEAAPQLTRKRKHYDQENFSSQHTNAHWLDAPMLREEEPSELSQLVTAAATKRRYSFAACIVDLNIPELNAREGPWVEDVSVM